MGSEGGTPAVTVHVTGFKKFQGVLENPTEKIVNNLKDFVTERGLSAGITLGSCIVLETAGEGGLPMLYNVMESGISEPFNSSSSNEQVIWVHFGVNSSSQKFTIECQAVNEASFRCPDELGWHPQSVTIIPEDGGTSRKRQTSCSVDAIVQFLKKKDYDVVISDDGSVCVQLRLLPLAPIC